jgi:SAM-dependent methyltransferase
VGIEQEYWTHRVFVDYASIYAEVLRAKRSAALPEVRGIRRILDRQGIPRDGRVLDIACGIGRHIIPLAKAGYRAVGCDFSPGFIEEARKWARQSGLGSDRIRFYLTDYRRVDRALRRRHEPRFDAAICIFTSMGHYGDKGDIATLKAARHVVRPGGVFVLEMGDRDSILRRFKESAVDRSARGLEIHERRHFDWERSTMHSMWTFLRRVGRRRRKIFQQEITIRLYSLHELRALFERSGWEYLRSYGSLSTLEPVSLESRRLVVVAQRPIR